MEQAIVDGGTGVSAAEEESKANAIHAKEKRKQRAFLELKNERRLLQALNVVEVTKPKPCSLMARCSPSPLAGRVVERAQGGCRAQGPDAGACTPLHAVGRVLRPLACCVCVCVCPRVLLMAAESEGVARGCGWHEVLVEPNQGIWSLQVAHSPGACAGQHQDRGGQPQCSPARPCIASHGESAACSAARLGGTHVAVWQTARDKSRHALIAIVAERDVLLEVGCFLRHCLLHSARVLHRCSRLTWCRVVVCACGCVCVCVAGPPSCLGQG